MKVVVVGATGNIGTAVLDRLLAEPEVTTITGVARRTPLDAEAARSGRVEWVSADVRRDPLADLLRGADCVVHLAWMFQPSHRPEVTWETNAVGTARVLEAVAAAGVPHVVAASSIAAYSPRTDLTPVDESWPTHGASAAPYAREKAYVERLLDAAEAREHAPVVTRLRPAFVFQRRAASEQKRIFIGRLVPQGLIRPALVPVLPFPHDVPFQAVHASDLADAVVRTVVRRAGGPFNLAGPDVIEPDDLAELLQAPRVGVPAGVLRNGLAAAWKARLVPADPKLFDALTRLPIMSCERAVRELGWRPEHTAQEALAELLAALPEKAGHGTAPLHPTGS
ncbi:NAD-dependent epimerase/dehydratase family protein [Nocardioides sp. 616]|uniref:NAD-dependent epimerase/dehydratase family protein n=1 Tax=Nocardioides sp. 616 TaxID=2268090 RepID=UPI000CE54B96|nr:NAD-dependent epimerase/dehydratase family protein [Nocardioides sp. 616]